MDKVKEPVNWSATAADAFELKLGELARKAKEKTMDAVVQRLRVSKLKHRNDSMTEGMEAGTAWAKDSAEWDQLERIAEIDAGDIGAGEPMAPYGRSDYLAFEILGTPNDEHDRSVSTDFWDTALGDAKDKRLDSVPFLQGFVTGAAEFYSNVRDEVGG